jgi:hypothetical protein
MRPCRNGRLGEAVAVLAVVLAVMVGMVVAVVPR